MIKVCMKFALALALILWLLKSGRIDFHIMVHSLENPWSWALCLLILVINVLIITWRWKGILEIKSRAPFPFLSILRLTWIGNLFNTILPGAISGDIIKLFYAYKMDKGLSKTYLAASVIFDRFIGLFGLLLLLGFFSLINYGSLTSASPQVTNLIHFNFMVTLGMVVIFSFFFLPTKFQNLVINFLQKIPGPGKMLASALPQIWSLGQNKKSILWAICLSFIAQGFNIVAFWTMASPYLTYVSSTTQPLTLPMAFTFIPLGFVTTAIPITPAGLGIGHAAFSTLFSYFGVKNGASLFNLYFFATVSINLMGIFPYLKSGMKYSEKEMAEFNSAA